MQPYTANFFSTSETGSSRSAKQTIPLLLEWIHPASVIDVGCGIGTWLAAFQECNITDLVGIDGDYVDREMLKIPKEKFQGMDLTQPFQIARTFDLAISLEVAEHLPDASAAGFVASLVQLAPIIVFSAAVPGQGGVEHVNEQWPEYWRDHFAHHDYILVDCIRYRLWHDEAILWHYRQNMLLFVRADSIRHYPEIYAYSQNAAPAPLSIVHPGMYAGLYDTTNPEKMPLRQAWKNLSTTFSRAIRRRLSGSRNS